MKNYILIITLLFASISTYADDDLYNVVEFDIVLEKELPNDQLKVMMAVEGEGDSPAKLSEKINKDMAWALKKAKQSKEVKVQTLSYSVYPIYDDRSEINGWYASQELELSSVENITGLSELVGKLQDRLQVKDMQFTTTPAVRQRYENELIEEALQAVKQRAAVIQKHMDAKNMRILDIDINTDDGNLMGRHPIMFDSIRGRAMSGIEEIEAEPAIAMGTGQITITVMATLQFF